MRKLLLDIYNANDYDALHQLVHSNKFLSDCNNWKPYGNNPNNCGTFEGQQAKPEAALVEKITNSIDAILIKECKKIGLDPENSKDINIPKSMTDAVEKFFCIAKGKWENASEKQRRQIASKLQIILTGDNRTPNITIYDNGEGQNPEDFENTFLSLLRGNKMKIPFVQGKFNMGSTGAVIFCGGDEKYQLIISRRSNELLDGNHRIGFTLVRKHPLTDEEETSMKSTWYEYFVVNNSIPYIEVESLDLGLNDTQFIDGTIIKLYSYELTRGCQSDATFDLWRELNSLLYEASIPVLICEQRDYKGHSKTKLMLGNKTRISIDDREKKHATLSFSINNLKDFGAEIPIEVTIFHHDIKNTEFIRRRSMVFLLNGQTQGSEGRTFISTELGFRQLRDNMLISVDCTNVKTSIRNDIFMSSRDRMREGKYYDILKQEIINLLKHDENLKRINQEYKGKILRESKDDQQLIEALFSNLNKNNDLRKLFSGNNGSFSFSSKNIKSKEVSDTQSRNNNSSKALKRFPSYFKVRDLKEINGKKYKAISKGGKGIIKFETDAEDEFLTRNIDKGSFEINVLGYGKKPRGGTGVIYPSTPIDTIKVKRSGPYNGEIKLSIEPNESVDVGDVLEISAKLISAAGDLEVIIFIQITEDQKNRTLTPKSKTTKEPELNLPKAIRVFKEKKDENSYTWEDCGMTSTDIVKLEIGENNAIDEIRINMDSNLMKKQINKLGISVEEVSKRYFASIYSHSLMLYSTLIGYYSSQDNSLDLGKSDIDALKEDLNFALEFVFQYYGGFLMDFDAEDLVS